MKILYVSARFPWPLLTGDALRAYNQIKSLSKFHSIDVFSIEAPPVSRGDIDLYISESMSSQISKLQKIINIISYGKDTAFQCAMYNDMKSWQELRRLIISNKYDVIIFQLVRLEYLIKKTVELKNQLGLDISIYCDYVDALSLNMENRTATEGLLLKKICSSESRKLKKIENEIYDLVDVKIIISERDGKYINNKGFNVVPNGVTIPVRNESLYHNESDGVVNLSFWGNMSYYPNVRAAQYLADIFRQLEVGKYKLHIIGAKPSKKVRDLGNGDNIIVHGFIDDLPNFLANMDLAVFPIFDGSGLQNKVLEAFALEIPVITTNVVLDSIPKLKKFAMVANCKADFIRNIESFELSKEKSPSESGVLKVLNEHYNWENINQVMIQNEKNTA
ncbi:glycosyltransferase, partial [Escherichia coli]|nr:glycosyltransferase [Escherichia coli]